MSPSTTTSETTSMATSVGVAMFFVAREDHRLVTVKSYQLPSSAEHSQEAAVCVAVDGPQFWRNRIAPLCGRSPAEDSFGGPLCWLHFPFSAVRREAGRPPDSRHRRKQVGLVQPTGVHSPETHQLGTHFLSGRIHNLRTPLRRRDLFLGMVAGIPASGRSLSGLGSHQCRRNQLCQLPRGLDRRRDL